MAKSRLPAFLQDHPGLGSLGNVEVPRLKLLQASSPELAQAENAKEGEFWHSLLGRSIGSSDSHLPGFYQLVLHLVAPAGSRRRNPCSCRR